MERTYTDRELELLEGRARNAGLRLTRQRLEVFRALAQTTEHPSAETVWREVRKKAPAISLDTVYRTLAVLEQLGLARKVPAGLDQARFDADMGPHHHFVCRRCQRVFDVDWPEFNDLHPPEAVEALGRVEIGEVVFKGVCHACAAQEDVVTARQ